MLEVEEHEREVERPNRYQDWSWLMSYYEKLHGDDDDGEDTGDGDNADDAGDDDDGDDDNSHLDNILRISQ